MFIVMVRGHECVGFFLEFLFSETHLKSDIFLEMENNDRKHLALCFQGSGHYQIRMLTNMDNPREDSSTHKSCPHPFKAKACSSSFIPPSSRQRRMPSTLCARLSCLLRAPPVLSGHITRLITALILFDSFGPLTTLHINSTIRIS